MACLFETALYYIGSFTKPDSEVDEYIDPAVTSLNSDSSFDSQEIGSVGLQQTYYRDSCPEQHGVNSFIHTHTLVTGNSTILRFLVFPLRELWVSFNQ